MPRTITFVSTTRSRRFSGFVTSFSEFVDDGDPALLRLLCREPLHPLRADFLGKSVQRSFRARPLQLPDAPLAIALHTAQLSDRNAWPPAPIRPWCLYSSL